MISIPNDLQFDVNLSILFTDLPLSERAAAAASAGFDAVEFWWPFPAPVPGDQQIDDFVRSIEDADVSLVGLNFYAGDMPNGDRGVVSIPGAQKAFRDSVDVLVSIAQRTGCRAFNALYGQRVEGVDPREQDELAIENLSFAAKAVSDLGGVVLIEPLTFGENGSYPLLTAADVLAVMDGVTQNGGPENVFMLADLYHLSSNGEDIEQVVTTYVTRIGHVQIADAPGRGEPGTGKVDFEKAFRLLADHGYPGFVGLEYRPSGSSFDSLDWLPVHRRSAFREVHGTER